MVGLSVLAPTRPPVCNVWFSKEKVKLSHTQTQHWSHLGGGVQLQIGLRFHEKVSPKFTSLDMPTQSTSHLKLPLCFQIPLPVPVFGSPAKLHHPSHLKRDPSRPKRRIYKRRFYLYFMSYILVLAIPDLVHHYATLFASLQNRTLQSVIVRRARLTSSLSLVSCCHATFWPKQHRHIHDKRTSASAGMLCWIWCTKYHAGGLVIHTTTNDASNLLLGAVRPAPSSDTARLIPPRTRSRRQKYQQQRAIVSKMLSFAFYKLLHLSFLDSACLQ